MRTNRPLSLCAVLLACGAQAQYCSPTFANGCQLWHNQSVIIGSIDLTIDASGCGVSDHTAMSTVVEPGVPEAMTVVSGNWTGCAVWVDLNNDQSFEDAENLYYSYVGGDPNYTYSFDITLPPGTPDGNYRMRVIAPWGSDGFTEGSANGYGACGDFQYGNFDDLTLTVGTGTGMQGADASPLRIRPNPATDHVSITRPAGMPVQRIIVTGADGRMVLDLSVATTAGPIDMDLTGLAAGTYAITGISGSAAWTTRLVVR